MGIFKKTEFVNETEFTEIVTFDDCLRYFAKQQRQFPQICAFVLSVEKSMNPQNDNDKLVVIQGLLDNDYKAITLDGTTGLSRIIHTKTIDKKMIDFLAGESTKIYERQGVKIMPFPFLAIAAVGFFSAIAVGAIIYSVVKFVLPWIRDKLEAMLAKKNVKKAFLSDIGNLAKDCKNKKTLSDLDKLVDEGYEFVAVAFDDDTNIIGDVELIKDTNESLDDEVEDLLGLERMVVVSI